jgi:hypothetical protein
MSIYPHTWRQQDPHQVRTEELSSNWEKNDAKLFQVDVNLEKIVMTTILKEGILIGD